MRCLWSLRYCTCLLFWYQVLTWVSVSPILWARSTLSWTDRYFWRSKVDSSSWSCLSVKIVLAFLAFFPWIGPPAEALEQFEALSVLWDRSWRGGVPADEDLGEEEDWLASRSSRRESEADKLDYYRKYNLKYFRVDNILKFHDFQDEKRLL